MAKRPVYYIENNKVKEKMIEFKWYPGYSIGQKQKSILSFHENIQNEFEKSKILEISSKSLENLGINLSAFNLIIKTKKKEFSVESAFQSSKVFEKGGPYKDLLYKTSREAKKDPRIKSSGNLVKFQYNKIDWELEPKTFFYDWLYINALYKEPKLSKEIIKYDTFTDIEFNPQKSINCQARSAALFVLLKKLNLLNKAVENIEKYKEIVKQFYVSKTANIEKEEIQNNINQLSFDHQLIEKNSIVGLKREKIINKKNREKQNMNTAVHNKLISFIWSIADDCLRDVYVRGKYRDVILPMVVLRRLDTLLEPSKEKVLEELEFQKIDLELTELDSNGLCDASGYVFYNTSQWTLQKLFNTASNSQQILQANFEEYLNGFSKNVQEIINNFELKNKVRDMAKKDVLLNVLEKFTSPKINFTPLEMKDPDGNKLPALTNLGMGYVFEELIRQFNEENNEEAGEHFTPREVIDLMTHIVFEPIKDKLPPVMTMYDPACGSGGMLTEAQNFIKDESGNIRSNGDIYLYGKEINSETFAICKSDMMIKGNDPENIKLGSTLSTNEFAGTKFDFMLSNPPYGKSWASEVKYIKDGKDIIDSRFKIELEDYFGNKEEVDATPRSSDGQLLFLMEMVDKMKPLNQSPYGSRIASVHNGSSLFTGDASGGESNIRRYIIENDMLECIVQLPNNLFYNTGITTYIWFLNNNKSENKKGKVQLIDANELYKKLRKNLGNKNYELSPKNIEEIQETFNNFMDIQRTKEKKIASKIFNNADFGYYKVVIERPERLKAQFNIEKISHLRFERTLLEPMKYAYETFGNQVYENLESIEKEILEWCEKNEINLNTKKKNSLLSPKTWEKQKNIVAIAETLTELIGTAEYKDFNSFKEMVDKVIKENKIKVTPAEKKAILNAITEYDESAEKVIKKKIKLTGSKLDELLKRLECKEEELSNYGYYKVETGEYIVYETNSDLRDNENVPLKENIYDYFIREVKPHVEEAWVDLEKTKIGYEISFNKYFYQHKPLRSIEKVAADILALEKENEGLIMDILGVK